MIRDLLDKKTGQPFVVQEGESHNVTGSFVDADGAAINLASLATFEITLYNENGNQIINSKDAQDAKNANGHTVASDGSFIVRLNVADSSIEVEDPVIAEQALQYHILRLVWTWSDGVAVRTGIEQLRFAVQKLEVTV